MTFRLCCKEGHDATQSSLQLECAHAWVVLCKSSRALEAGMLGGARTHTSALSLDRAQRGRFNTLPGQQDAEQGTCRATSPGLFNCPEPGNFNLFSACIYTA